MLIFLDKDELEENFAYCLNTTIESEKDLTEETRWNLEKQAIEREILMTELNAKLSAARLRADLEKKRTPKERLTKSFEEHYASAMGSREIAVAQTAEVTQRYKDDPEMLKDALKTIEDWLRQET